jgi:hypothetical protein
VQKYSLLLILFFITIFGGLQAQQNIGSIQAVVLGSQKQQPLQSTTINLLKLDSTKIKRVTTTEKDGNFKIANLPFGYYKLSLTSIAYQTVTIDSILIRPEKYYIDLNEIILKPASPDMLAEVIIYQEKPLFENKDGNLTFNVSQSAQAQNSTATELLQQTPLVTVGPDGKVLVKGKEVKILIDEKPVELNAKELQDLLESMPGSTIDKIEVLTTPPPQFANERGGVINITTKKGKVGFSGRLVVNYGTRGEASINSSINYRKNKLSIGVNAGFGYNKFLGSSFSNRTNLFTDSVNYFNTQTTNNTANRRPNARLQASYDFNKQHSLSLTTTLNANESDYNNTIAYNTLNRVQQLYKLSIRAGQQNNNSNQFNSNLTYKFKKTNSKTGLQINLGYNISNNNNLRNFTQTYKNGNNQTTQPDSLQQQNTTINNTVFFTRINYDKPVFNTKWLLNIGGNFNQNTSKNILNTNNWDNATLTYLKNNLLSNDFVFTQKIIALRAALRYDASKATAFTFGLAIEKTNHNFNFLNQVNNTSNQYYNALPFVTFLQKWDANVTLNFSYKTSVNRPGITELNPSIDYSDPFTTRAGNPFLNPAYVHAFDVAIGKFKTNYNINFGLGVNKISNIFSTLRSLLADNRTSITWQNISGRTEYEATVWGGYTISKKSRINASLGYIYNQYNAIDIAKNKFNNGASILSSLNGNYEFSPLFTSNLSVAYNRFANPQGISRTNLSINFGVQYKLFAKKITVSFNAIDPFAQQANNTNTIAPNFIQNTTTQTNTRNFRFSVAYNFNKQAAKKSSKKK